MKRANPIIAMAIAAFCCWFILAACFDLRRVEGRSMEPTIAEGRTIVVWRLAYALRIPAGGLFFEWKNVNRNDIIVAEHPETGEVVVKRCTGIPGDYVVPDGDALSLINDDSSSPLPNEAHPIPEGYLYVQGDRPDSSFDSRHYGLIRSTSVIGRVVFLGNSAEAPGTR